MQGDKNREQQKLHRVKMRN